MVLLNLLVPMYRADIDDKLPIERGIEPKNEFEDMSRYCKEDREILKKFMLPENLLLLSCNTTKERKSPRDGGIVPLIEFEDSIKLVSVLMLFRDDGKVPCKEEENKFIPTTLFESQATFAQSQRLDGMFPTHFQLANETETPSAAFKSHIAAVGIDSILLGCNTNKKIK